MRVWRGAVATRRGLIRSRDDSSPEASMIKYIGCTSLPGIRQVPHAFRPMLAEVVVFAFDSIEVDDAKYNT